MTQPKATPKAKPITHYFSPGQMDRYASDNVYECCDRPEADHPVFAVDTKVRIRLTRQVRGIRGSLFPKGTVLEAERETYTAMKVIERSRWFKNERGNMEEQRGKYENVEMPAYMVEIDDCRTSLPLRYAVELEETSR